jgi:hypothetical protein
MRIKIDAIIYGDRYAEDPAWRLWARLGAATTTAIDRNRNTAQLLCSQSGARKRENNKQLRRDHPRSDVLVFRASPASIVGYRLENCSPNSFSSMPPLDFLRVTHGINIPYEHTSYTNFTLQNEQNRRQGNVHRPRAGNPVLSMLMLSDGYNNHANPFRNGRGRSQSVSSTILPVHRTDGRIDIPLYLWDDDDDGD